MKHCIAFFLWSFYTIRENNDFRNKANVSYLALYSYMHNFLFLLLLFSLSSISHSCHI